ncbi:MAG: class II aldolase/adducin family protein [Planctomycetes bacterium]|nr:class II aldolase/adducin family protein [Planctomycetota bacterium]
MMNEYKIKEQICEVGRRLYNKGFSAANDGNITVRLNDREVLCTPTMVSKGFMKPEDLCKVDYEGNQLSGTRPRSSEVLLHLAAYKHNPKIQAVVHCHPPHASAFAVAREPIPKCILPEVEVMLGEVPLAVYETPGTQKFAETIVPYVQHCNTILLVNHGTVTFGPDLERAYFHTEIIDAYCRILLLARQLGRVHYFTEQQTRELVAIRQRMGYDDPRLECADCELCGESFFQKGYGDFHPEPQAFKRPEVGRSTAGSNGQAVAAPDLEKLVQLVTDQVIAALNGASK